MTLWKVALAVALGILVAVGIYVAVAQFRGARDALESQAAAKIEREYLTGSDAWSDKAKVEYALAVHGKRFADRYWVCLQFTPSFPPYQAECRKMNDRIERELASARKSI